MRSEVGRLLAHADGPHAMTEQKLLEAIAAEPGDVTGWLALADWLEEHSQPDRAELSRLSTRLRTTAPAAASPERDVWEDRVRQLVAAGARPALPGLTNTVGMRLVQVPPGAFVMGSPRAEQDEAIDRGAAQDSVRREGPQHEVEIARAFYLGAHEVTQEQYERVTGTNPSSYSPTGSHATTVRRVNARRLPVDSVSWHDAVRFCELLSGLDEEKRHGRRYRLPTEAEWEYACRAGTSTAYHHGNAGISTLMNFDGHYPFGGAARSRYLGRPRQVGSYLPNAFGLYDMHGNLWEWCADWFDEDYYKTSPRRSPTGPPEGTMRVLRGGSYYYSGLVCRAAYRFREEADSSNEDRGLRVACDVTRGR